MATRRRRTSRKITKVTHPENSNVKKAVESGIGIASLPDYMMQSAESVSKIIPEVKGPSTEVYLIYPVELRNSKRINVFRDFILRKLAQDGWGKGPMKPPESYA